MLFTHQIEQTGEAVSLSVLIYLEPLLASGDGALISVRFWRVRAVFALIPLRLHLAPRNVAQVTPA